MKKVDFSKECSVFVIGRAEGSDTQLKFKYERPQVIDDYTLTEEAKINFENMKKNKLQNVSELICIYIARSEEQYNDITK